MVGHDHGLAGERGTPHLELDAGRVDVLSVQLHVLELSLTAGEGQFSGNQPGQRDLAVADNVDQRGIDVRKLVAFRIHLPVVGIPFVGVVIGRIIDPNERSHARQTDLGRNGGANAAPVAQQLLPSLEAGILNHLGQVVRVGVLRVELLGVVGGLPQPSLGAGIECLVQDDERIGPIKGQADRVFVHLLHGQVLAVGTGTGAPSAGRTARGEFLVVPKILPGEDEIIRSEGIAIRPLEALAQVQHLYLAAVAELPAFGQTTADAAEVLVDAQNEFGSHHGLGIAEEMVGVANGHHGLAAILANRVPGHNHLRIGWQAFLDRGQFTSRDPLRQHRRFAEPAAHVDGGGIFRGHGIWRIRFASRSGS